MTGLVRIFGLCVFAVLLGYSGDISSTRGVGVNDSSLGALSGKVIAYEDIGVFDVSTSFNTIVTREDLGVSSEEITTSSVSTPSNRGNSPINSTSDSEDKTNINSNNSSYKEDKSNSSTSNSTDTVGTNPKQTTNKDNSNTPIMQNSTQVGSSSGSSTINSSNSTAPSISSGKRVTKMSNPFAFTNDYKELEVYRNELGILKKAFLENKNVEVFFPYTDVFTESNAKSSSTVNSIMGYILPNYKELSNKAYYWRCTSLYIPWLKVTNRVENGVYISPTDKSLAFVYYGNKTYSTLSGIINNGMTELEVVNALNKYLTYSISYDYSGLDSGFYGKREDVVRYLVESKSTICAGYSYFFAIGCAIAGIDVRYVSSEGMNHAWNKVKIGSEWFYIDTTWNSCNRNEKKYYLSKTIWNDHNYNDLTEIAWDL